MAQTVRDIMTADPRTVNASDSIVDAAKVMDQADVGPVIVLEDGAVSGILTDRDIVIRAVAEGKDPKSTKVGDVCTKDPTTLSPDEDVDRAISVMRDQKIRRLPVVENDRAVGILSLGDVAVDRDPGSTLAEISAGSPQE
jgi:CBS domain-containing protein